VASAFVHGDWGILADGERTAELVSDLIDRARDAALDVKTVDDSHARAGIVMIRCRDLPAVIKTLAARGVLADYRHDRVRISPYFYNTPEDNARAIDAISGQL